MKITRFGIRAAFLLIAVFALSATNIFAQKPTNIPAKAEDSAAETNEKTVDFDFTDLNGKAHKFSEFRGKVVLVDFWATWCAPCLADIPKLKAIYEKHKSDDFEIVGMNVETIGGEDETPIPAAANETDANAKRIVTTRGVNWTTATSETAVPVATKMFGIESLPAKILIDKDGKVVAEIGEKDDLIGIVEKLLAASK